MLDHNNNMFCSNCGTKISDDAAFCFHCGAPVEQDVNQVSSKSAAKNQLNNKKKPVIIGACCAVAAAVVVAGAALGITRKVGVSSVDDLASEGYTKTAENLVATAASEDITTEQDEQMYEVTEDYLASIVRGFFEFQAEVTQVNAYDANLEGMQKSTYSTNSVNIVGTDYALYTIDPRFRIVNDYDECNFYFGTVPENYFRKLGSCDNYYFDVEVVDSNLTDSVYTYSEGTDKELTCNMLVHLTKFVSGETEVDTFGASASFVNETAHPDEWLICGLSTNFESIVELDSEGETSEELKKAYVAYADYIENHLADGLFDEYVNERLSYGEDTIINEFEFKFIDIDGDDIPEIYCQGVDWPVDDSIYYDGLSFVLSYYDGVVYKNGGIVPFNYYSDSGFTYVPGQNKFEYGEYKYSSISGDEWFSEIYHMENGLWVADGGELSEDYQIKLNCGNWENDYWGIDFIDYLRELAE